MIRVLGQAVMDLLAWVHKFYLVVHASEWEQFKRGFAEYIGKVSDFQQTLPIIPKGTKEQIIEACI